MRVLVTGGAGFIGREVSQQLLAAGHEVYILDNFSNANPDDLAYLQPRIQVKDLDIRSNTARNCIADWDPDAVLHLAAYISAPASVQDKEACLSINVEGTANVFAALPAEVPVVFASSAAVYEGQDGICIETSVNFAEGTGSRCFGSPYGQSKAEGEFLTLQRGNAAVLRFFNVYGSGQNGAVQYPAVLPAFQRAVASNEPLCIFGDGLQTRDFVHVRDVAAVCVAFLEKPGQGVWNVGTGISRSILSLAGLLQAKNGTIRIEHKEARVGDIRHCVADVTTLGTHLGWVPPDRLAEYIHNDWALLE